MIAEAKQQYRGVRCRHCHQPIPLSSSAARKEKEFEERGLSGLDEFAVRSFTLRCRVCHGEGFYTALDVIDCDGSPRIRGSHARKAVLNDSKNLFADLSDLTKSQSKSKAAPG
jgi:hypothetical protein